MILQSDKLQKRITAANARAARNATTASNTTNSTPKVDLRKNGPAMKRLGNTADYHYFHNRKLSKQCKEDYDRIVDACDKNTDTKKNNEAAMKNARLGANANSSARRYTNKLKESLRELDDLVQKSSGYSVTDQNEWMQNHCSGLWQKPGGGKGPEGEVKIPNTEEFKKRIEKEIQDATDAAQILETEARDKIMSFADDYMKNHLTEVLKGVEEKALKRAIAARIPGATTILARIGMWEGLGTLLGNAAAAYVTNDIERLYQEVVQKAADATSLVENLKKIMTVGGLEDLMASTMSGIAYANPCIKARKCLLIPYKNSENLKEGNGCCPGQTGHHILPNAMFTSFKPEMKKDGKNLKKLLQSDGPRECWADYDKNEALTICLEGTTNRATNGSHGLAHELTAAIVAPYRKSADMPYTEARDKVAAMVATAYGCNAECIKEQLDDSLKDKHSCGDLESAQVSPHSGEVAGGPLAPVTVPPPITRRSTRSRR
ncbi:HNH/endonuclease VII fold toxin-2 domain-containing protein [Massilia scottii]|uniref:HNH/endonuclease VII fold toxin-2 domain-containing protein n=1 Tax=Massilia scottii TaxID=3057166 RepID=UPI0027964F4C|nr:HNH/endonuclease VII fold toxin-2 domain-containing protein [Massilia sp. CCM 9029]MDQ1834719.1 HNH/endonuclease VII fold toxin-2 domain-containing protein [Massilia sp. CCM 9029]